MRVRPEYLASEFPHCWQGRAIGKGGSESEHPCCPDGDLPVAHLTAMTAQVSASIADQRADVRGMRWQQRTYDRE